MAGGAQLVSDLLQGAFGSDNINQSPAAGAYTHTPDTMFKELNANQITNGNAPYDSIQDAVSDGHAIDKPIYINPQTGENVTQYVKSPSDILPMKKPGFFQRAFAPYDASRANSINSSYATQPSFSTQADRTTSLIGSGHAAKVQSYLNGDQSITDTDPTTALYATGGDTSVSGMNRAETEANKYSEGLPSADAQSALSAAKAQGLVQSNIGREATEFRNEGGPEADATRNVVGDIANTLANKSRIKFQPTTDTLTGKQLQADIGDTDIRNFTQTERAKEALFKSHLRAILAGKEDEMAPALGNTLQNQARLGEVNSRFGQQPIGPVGMQVNPDGSVSYGRTGFTNPQLANAQAMTGGGGITGIDANGKKVSLPPMPIKTFDVNGQTRPTIAAPIKSSIQSNNEDEKYPEDKDGFHTDEQGNIWSKGHIIFTKEQADKMNVRGKLSDKLDSMKE